MDAARKSIGRLRSALKERGLPADLVTDAIIYSSAGYDLALAHVDLDLVRFEQLVARSGAAAPDERGAPLAETTALAARGEI